MAMMLSQDGQYTKGRESRWYEGNELILKLLKDGRKVKVLDVGCGETAGFKFLEEKALLASVSLANLEYHAVDNNPAIEPLLKDTKIIFHLFDIMNMEQLFEKESFDVIVASEIIEHVVETDRFINILKSLLKPDGYIYLTTPNLASWHARLWLLFGFQPLATEVSYIRAEFGKGSLMKRYYSGEAIMHIRLFTLRALLDILRYHNLKIEKVWGGGYRKIDDFLFKNLFPGLTPVIKILARKII